MFSIIYKCVPKWTTEIYINYYITLINLKMTIENKLEDKLKKKRLSNNDNYILLQLFLLPSPVLFLLGIAYYFDVNTKRYNVIKDDISYSVEAVKKGDTQIHVHKIIKDAKIEVMRKNGVEIQNYPNKYEYLKSCTIYREKKEITPIVKGVRYKTLERRTEEYIIPTEEELQICFNQIKSNN